MMPPQIVITIPYEGSPQIRLEAMNEAEEQRVENWLATQEPYLDLVERAVALRADRRAA
jgi:hypothetical protein